MVVLPTHPLVGQVVVGTVQAHLVVGALAPGCVAALVWVVVGCGMVLVVSVHAVVWVMAVVWVCLVVALGYMPAVVLPMTV